jgi:Putative peptidoglycan binding domain
MASTTNLQFKAREMIVARRRFGVLAAVLVVGIVVGVYQTYHASHAAVSTLSYNCNAPYPTIRWGSNDGGAPGCVTYMQALLYTMDYSIVVDGSFGNQTDAVVRSFQTNKGLYIDGVVGNQTWTALEAAYNRTYASSCSVNSPRTVTIGQLFSANVQIQNLGTAVWTPGGGNPYRLGSSSPHDNNTWGVGRVELAGPVSQGALANFTFNATAPTTPGIYSFDWQMVREAKTWIPGGCTSGTTVTVNAPAPVSAPTPSPAATPSAARTPTTVPATASTTAPAPSITSFTISPTSVSYGSSATLSWKVSDDATLCNGAGGTFGGAHTLPSGSTTTGPLTKSTTYSLTCQNTGPSSAVRTVSVTVAGQPAPPPPATCPAGKVGTPPNCTTPAGGGAASGGGAPAPNPTATTAAPDTTPPTVPGNFAAKSTNVGITLTWDDSSDNSGRVAYFLERSSTTSVWEPIAKDARSGYLDTSTRFGTIYSYRIQASDPSGNTSGYGTAQVTTGAFAANTTDGVETKVFSSDGQVSIVIPAGAVPGSTACDVSVDDSNKKTLPTGINVAGGPYTLVCRRSSGEAITSFAKTVTVSVTIGRDKLAKYSKFTYSWFDQAQDRWTIQRTTNNKKTNATEFTTSSPVQFIILGVTQAAFPSWIVWVFVTLAILIAAAVVFLLRRQQKQAYDDYIRNKYYNL